MLEGVSADVKLKNCTSKTQGNENVNLHCVWYPADDIVASLEFIVSGAVCSAVIHTDLQTTVTGSWVITNELISQRFYNQPVTGYARKKLQKIYIKQIKNQAQHNIN